MKEQGKLRVVFSAVAGVTGAFGVLTAIWMLKGGLFLAALMTIIAVITCVLALLFMLITRWRRPASDTTRAEVLSFMKGVAIVIGLVNVGMYMVFGVWLTLISRN